MNCFPSLHIVPSLFVTFFFFVFLLFEIIYGVGRTLARGRCRVKGRAMMMDDAVHSVFHLLGPFLIKSQPPTRPSRTKHNRLALDLFLGWVTRLAWVGFLFTFLFCFHFAYELEIFPNNEKCKKN